MPDIFRSCALKERIDVLRDVHNIEMRSKLRNGIVRRIGTAFKTAKKALRVKVEDEQPVAFHPSGEATSSMRCCSHNPPESRNVGMPLSAESPAPLKTTMVFMNEEMHF